MERFFASPKEGPAHGEGDQARAEARASVFEHIGGFCNRVRRHSALGHKSSVEYEQAA